MSISMGAITNSAASIGQSTAGGAAADKDAVKYVENTLFSSGKLNQFSKRLMFSHFTINSVFRPDCSNTCSTDFIVELPNPLKKVASYEVTSFCITPLFYNIFSDPKSNKLTIQLENLPNKIDNNNVNIALEEGLYQPNEIISFFNGLFAASSTGLQFLRCDYNFIARRIVFRPYNFWIDGYLTQLVNGAIVLGGGVFNPQIINPVNPTTLIPNPFYSPSCVFVLDFTAHDVPPIAVYRTLGWILGFTCSMYEISMESSRRIYNKTYFNFYNRFSTSVGPTFLPGYTNNLYLQTYFGIDPTYMDIYGYLEGDNLFVDRSAFPNSGIYVYLDVDDYNKNYSSSETISLSTNFDCTFSATALAKINISTALITIDNTPNRIFFGPVDLRRFHIRLLNQYGDVVELHGDFTFTMRVTQIY
jgi:hypothetical protein